ncbi:MAG: hypothetical protein FJ044_01070 [Candidatus Cloacimonetes bacterium]|nr:hypothetical protein [Candidatus Cloacimonadota bacterium]
MFKDIFTPKKGKFVAIGLVFLMLLTFLNVYVSSLTVKQKATATPSPTAILSLSPEQAYLVKDQIFSVNIIFNPGQESVDAVDAVLVYDPNLLEVLGLIPSELFASYPVQDFGEGKIQLSAFAVGTTGNPKPVTESGTLGTISLKAKAVGIAKLEFSSDSIVASKGANVLEETSGGVYTIK